MFALAVIVDASRSHMHSHTFFPTEAASRSPLSAPAPLSPVPPLTSSIVITPPVESYFTPLSMLPNASTSMHACVPPLCIRLCLLGDCIGVPLLSGNLGPRTPSGTLLIHTRFRAWPSEPFLKRSMYDLLYPFHFYHIYFTFVFFYAEYNPVACHVHRGL